MKLRSPATSVASSWIISRKPEMKGTTVRLGIFGGSFDPVHYGHLLLAECCREQCRLDQIRFIPAATSPLKRESQPVSAKARLEMLKLAIGGHPPFQVSDLEIERGGLSYTVDTLRSLQAEDTTRELYLLMGADAVAEFPKWKAPATICQLARLVVVSRAGSGEPDFDVLRNVVPNDELDQIRSRHVHMPQIAISSSEIRRRVCESRSIRFQLPRAVEKYIESHQLYAATTNRRANHPPSRSGQGNVNITEFIQDMVAQQNWRDLHALMLGMPFSGLVPPTQADLSGTLEAAGHRLWDHAVRHAEFATYFGPEAAPQETSEGHLWQAFPAEFQEWVAAGASGITQWQVDTYLSGAKLQYPPRHPQAPKP